MIKDEMLDISLATIGGGELDDTFRGLVPALIRNLGPDEKATVNIAVEFKRVRDTDSLITTKTRITPKFPAKVRHEICSVVGGDLKVEPPQEDRQLRLLGMNEGGEKDVRTAGM